MVHHLKTKSEIQFSLKIIYYYLFIFTEFLMTKMIQVAMSPTSQVQNLRNHIPCNLTHCGPSNSIRSMPQFPYNSTQEDEDTMQVFRFTLASLPSKFEGREVVKDYSSMVRNDRMFFTNRNTQMHKMAPKSGNNRQNI